ncbi:unnamed protein product [Allacma fusca]|uniref:BACK domain-containing protein n=1 Tax=Allacma fusca TaxID=39272 RepID=A0A8J2L0P7_9HEXA|nr:unnamed protein product [Allacma fusca]
MQLLKSYNYGFIETSAASKPFVEFFMYAGRKRNATHHFSLLLSLYSTAETTNSFPQAFTMDGTEGQETEIDPANVRGIVQATLENPMNISTSVDSFGITVDVPVQDAAGRIGNPWVMKRIARTREMITNGNVDDPRNVIFHIENAEQLHKFVLNKSLLIFSSLWFSKFLEESIGICKIGHVNARHFECIVHYLLGHFTWEFTTMEDTCEQIETANTYKLKGFNDELFERLVCLITSKKANFNNDIVCRALGLFTNLDTNDVLEKSARGYILKNAAIILRGDKFLELSSEDLLEFFISDDLAVDSELDVYKALLRWGVHNLKEKSELITTENMQQSLISLFPTVRISNMSRSEIRNYILPLQLLLPDHTRCITDWCHRSTRKPEYPFSYSNVRRNYNRQADEARENDTHEESELERAHANVFLAKYDRDNNKYNFNLELLKIRREMVNEISNEKHKLNQAIEEHNHTKEILNQTKNTLNQTIEILNRKEEALQGCTLMMKMPIQRLVCTVILCKWIF